MCRRGTAGGTSGRPRAGRCGLPHRRRTRSDWRGCRRSSPLAASGSRRSGPRSIGALHHRGVAVLTIHSGSSPTESGWPPDDAGPKPLFALRLSPWRGGASCFPPDGEWNKDAGHNCQHAATKEGGEPVCAVQEMAGCPVLNGQHSKHFQWKHGISLDASGTVAGACATPNRRVG